MTRAAPAGRFDPAWRFRRERVAATTCFVVVEAAAALLGLGSLPLLLADVALVPAGAIAGVVGLTVLARRRAAAAQDAGGDEVPAAALAGVDRSQRFTRLVHGLLLGNLGLFALGAATVALVPPGDLANGLSFTLLPGAVVIASAAIPFVVAATWWSARDRPVLRAEARALRDRTGGARLIRATRWLARVSLLLHGTAALLLLVPLLALQRS